MNSSSHYVFFIIFFFESHAISPKLSKIILNTKPWKVFEMKSFVNNNGFEIETANSFILKSIIFILRSDMCPFLSWEGRDCPTLNSGFFKSIFTIVYIKYCAILPRPAGAKLPGCFRTNATTRPGEFLRMSLITSGSY